MIDSLRGRWMPVLCAACFAWPLQAQPLPKHLLEARARRELEAQRKKDAAERAKAAAEPIRIAPDRKNDVPDLRKILEEWNARARQSVKQLNTWPPPDKKTAAHYMGLMDDQIIAVLGTSVDSDPEMDAYLKTQLFYFRPSLRKASEEQFLDIIGAMPAPPEAKQPPASMMKYFEKGERKALDPKLAEKLMETWRSLQGRSDTAQADAYRAKLLENLPRGKGLRFCASFQDFYNRYDAGDASCLEKPYKQRLLSDAERAWKLGEDFSPASRQRLKVLLKRLESMARNRRTTERLVAVEKTADGKFKLTRLGAPFQADEAERLSQFISTTPPTTDSGA